MNATLCEQKYRCSAADVNMYVNECSRFVCRQQLLKKEGDAAAPLLVPRKNPDLASSLLFAVKKNYDYVLNSLMSMIKSFLIIEERCHSVPCQRVAIVTALLCVFWSRHAPLA